jgi:hypothetical protein
MEHWWNYTNWEQPLSTRRGTYRSALFPPHLTWTSLGSNGLSNGTSFSWIVELFIQLRKRCKACYSFVEGVICNFYFNVRKNKFLELLRGWHSCFTFGGFLLQVSDRRPVLVTKFYRGFSHFLQVNAMILRQIRPRPIASVPFTIYCSPNTLFCTEASKESVNKPLLPHNTKTVLSFHVLYMFKQCSWECR